MTGRYPMRYGLQTLAVFSIHTCGLATDGRALPQPLKKAGCHTAMVGKWHMGHADQKYWPETGVLTTFMAAWRGSGLFHQGGGAALPTGSVTVDFSKKKATTPISLATTP